MKTAVFRVDSSFEIGTGHVMRCLALADELKDKGYEIIFITKDHLGNLAEFISNKGYKVKKIPLFKNQVSLNNGLIHSHWLGSSQEEDAKETLRLLKEINVQIDLLVIDHYAIDYRWESKLRSSAKKIFIIDDLADRKHECDLLLDQNYYIDHDIRYQGLVNSSCHILTGPRFAILRKEFKNASDKVVVRNGSINRIFVFLGGSDPTNETMKVLNGLELFNRKNIIYDIVVGASNPQKNEIEKKVLELGPNYNYYCQISNMADLMSKADLSIGAGGSTTWERMYLGLPSLIITVAQNQVQAALDLSEKQGIIYLGHYNEITSKDIYKSLLVLENQPQVLKEISETAAEIMGLDNNKQSVVDFIIN